MLYHKHLEGCWSTSNVQQLLTNCFIKFVFLLSYIIKYWPVFQDPFCLLFSNGTYVNLSFKTFFILFFIAILVVNTFRLVYQREQRIKNFVPKNALIFLDTFLDSQLSVVFIIFEISFSVT